MREPVRTMRARRGATRAEATNAAEAAPPLQRRVRKRLLGALLVSAIAVVAAGAPAIATSTRELSESQRLYRLTQLNTSAIALSHALADERDDAAAFVAAGRNPAGGHQVTPDEQAQVDRQAADLAQAAAVLDTGGSPDLVRATAGLRSELAGLRHLRDGVLSGRGTAKAAFDAYSPVIDSLDAVSGALARALPARAASPDTSAGPALARAVAQASAEHGLLVAALTAGGTESAPASEAQQARLREQAALSDFAATASQSAQTQYAQTVTGTDVTNAESYLDQLTARPYLTAADNALRTTDVDAALSARVERMRAVQASLAAADTTRIAALRNDDVTMLELRIALVGACLLLAVGIGVQTARSLTRPLAALRRYADDPQGAPPLGSRDEFAAIARSVERLGRDAARLREEARDQEAERLRLVGVRERTAAERDTARQRQAELSSRLSALEAEKDALLREKEELAARIGTLQGAAQSTFVNLSLRTLALVERQLALIEGLEDREQDPDQLETLFRLDHLATRMRRNSESLLVLAGADTHGGALGRPVPLLDVVRAGISEIERYERVQVAFLPRTQLAGFAADDASHLIAELMENATAFSPPTAEVQVSGWLLENGEVMLSVEDRGIGVPADRLAELNRLLTEPSDGRPETGTDGGLGLYVVARLAARHGIRVQLRDQAQGGVAAVVVLPRAIVVRPVEGVPADADADPVQVAAAGPGAVRQGAAAGELSSGHRRRAARAAGVPVERTPAGAGPSGPSGPSEHARPDADDAAAARPRHGRDAAPAHEPATAPATAAAPQPAPEPAPQPAPAGRSVTGLGLPKRVPRASGLSGEPATRGRGGPVDADALRRRLGGFAQGLRDGRRDAQAEATAPLPTPARNDSESSEEARG